VTDDMIAGIKKDLANRKFINARFHHSDLINIKIRRKPD